LTDIFRLKSRVKSSYQYVVFPLGLQNKLSEVVWEEPTHQVFDVHWKIVGRAQRGLTDRILASVDYLLAQTSIPLFSQKFVDKTHLSDKEIDFIPCQVISEKEKSHYFYIGRVHRFLPLIDVIETERAERLSVLASPIFRDNVSDFLIARDQDRRTMLVVSDRFKELCEMNSLCIDFSSVVVGKNLRKSDPR
jgi:hypothetical protein